MKKIEECTVDELKAYLDDVISLRQQFNARIEDVTPNNSSRPIVFSMDSNVYPHPDSYDSIPGFHCSDVRPIAEKLGLDILISPDKYLSEKKKVEKYVVYNDVAFFSLYDLEEEGTTYEEENIL